MAGSVDSTRLFVGTELSGAGASINAQAEAIAGELSALIGILAGVQDYWQGPAYTWYEGCQAEWNYAANGLFGPDGVLGQIASAMDIAWGNYSDAEWSNTSTWKTANS